MLASYGGAHLWSQLLCSLKPAQAKGTRPYLKNKLKTKELQAWLKW
jgi:hypothetical protein